MGCVCVYFRSKSFIKMCIFGKLYYFFFYLLECFASPSFQKKIESLFSNSLKGPPRDAIFVTSLKYIIVEPKNDLSSLRFFGIGLSLMALILSTNGAIPDMDILILNPPIFLKDFKIWPFDGKTLIVWNR